MLTYIPLWVNMFIAVVLFTLIFLAGISAPNLDLAHARPGQVMLVLAPTAALTVHAGYASISTHSHGVVVPTRNDIASEHMQLMRTGLCEQLAPLQSVRPTEAEAECGPRDIAAFRRWCAGGNTLGDAIQGMERVDVDWSSEGGLRLAASTSVPADVELFNVPPSMLLPATLEAASITMAGRLGREQLDMLHRTQQLSKEHTGRDLSLCVLLWQALIEAHASTPVTPNPSTGFEPWLRTYRYATMYPRGWSDAELEWVSAMPWASGLIKSDEFSFNQLGELCRTTELFWQEVLPTLREEYPKQVCRRERSGTFIPNSLTHSTSELPSPAQTPTPTPTPAPNSSRRPVAPHSHPRGLAAALVVARVPLHH